jgi:hypothetical protein
VRARLGYLTRKFKTLFGEELIALGVRDCEATPVVDRAEIAGARGAPEPTYVPPDQGPVARFLRKVGSRVRANIDTAAPARIASKLTGKVIRLLPDRSTFASILPGRMTVPPPQTSATANAQLANSQAPLPPPRPSPARSLLAQGHSLKQSDLVKLPPVISGGYRTLPPQLRAYAPVR